MTCITTNNAQEWYQGDDKSLYTTIWSPDVSVWTDWDGYLKAKRYLDDTEYVIDVSTVCVDSSMWVFTIDASVTASMSGDYLYQIYLMNTAGEIKTGEQERLTIIESVRL